MSSAKVYFIELNMPHHKDGDVCSLAERVFNAGKRVCIYCRETESARKLDNLLWTWKPDSFVPHHILDDGESDTDTRVFLAYGDNPFVDADTIILYDPLPASELTSFEFVFDFAEVYSEEKKLAGRKRYKEMMESGNFEMHFIKRGAFLRNAGRLTTS